MNRRRPLSGQSLMELLVGIAVGAIFVIGAASIIVPSLRVNTQAGNIQEQAQLGQELLKNVQSWASGNWSGVLALATGTANTYYLNTVSSPFSVAGASIAPTFIQDASNTAEENGSAYHTIAAQFSGAVTTGNAIVVAVTYATPTAEGVIGCRDGNNATSTYHLVINEQGIGGAGSDDIWYATNVTGGSALTVTCSFSTSSYYNDIAIHEFSGVATSSVVDGVASSTTGPTASTTWTTGSGTTTKSGDLILGLFQGNNKPQTLTPGAGFIKLVDNGNPDVVTTEYEIQSSAGSVAATATSSVGDQQANVMAAFAAVANSSTVESIQVCGGVAASACITYQRYFYLADVYRDASGNVTSTASNNFYDPSTKLVTVVVSQASSTVAPTTYSLYITRSGDNALSQSTWAGGSGQSGPVTTVNNTYASGTSITVNASGSIQLSGGSGGGGSCTL